MNCLLSTTHQIHQWIACNNSRRILFSWIIVRVSVCHINSYYFYSIIIEPIYFSYSVRWSLTPQKLKKNKRHKLNTKEYCHWYKNRVRIRSKFYRNFIDWNTIYEDFKYFKLKFKRRNDSLYVFFCNKTAAVTVISWTTWVVWILKFVIKSISN